MEMIQQSSIMGLESNKSYTRKTFKHKIIKKVYTKVYTGFCDYTVIRVKNGIVSFWYISDTDNVNHGQLSEELFIEEIA